MTRIVLGISIAAGVLLAQPQGPQPGANPGQGPAGRPGRSGRERAEQRRPASTSTIHRIPSELASPSLACHAVDT